MKRLNIIDGKFRELPFDESKPYVEVTDEQYEKIIDGDLICVNGELVNNPRIEEQINQLKANLQATDYQAIKFAEGELSAEDYASMKEQRRQWRVQINQLEQQLED